ncbi:MAG: hypothetical protein WD530_01995 [Vicingaceae bacterium]
MKKFKQILGGSLLVFTVACTTARIQKYDYTYLYNEDQKVIKPSFKVFHHSADSSTLHFELESENILFGKLADDST